VSRRVPAERLIATVAGACELMGASGADARRVATLLVRSNLAGYDSHGVFRLGQYHAWWRSGLLRPEAQPTLAAPAPHAAQVDGRRGFGQVAATFATRVAIEAATRAGIAVVTLRNSNHVGRLADYAEELQAAGLIGLVMANDSGAGQVVAPWGGMDGRLSTNPVAVGIPGGESGGILFDFSTSAAAHGTIRQLLLRGEAAPPGWLLDADGQPTRDPAAAFREPKGVLLPAGGPRGFGWSLAVEVLAGILSGAGCTRPQPGPEEMNGLFILALDVAPFLPLAEFRRRVDAMLDHVKSARPLPGGPPVRIPGERSRVEVARRAEVGVALPESTWEQLRAVCDELGMGHALDALASDAAGAEAPDPGGEGGAR
jgi:uncharacterized oxidoreductase